MIPKIVVNASPLREKHVAEFVLKRLPTADVYMDKEFNGNMWNTARILADSPDGVLFVEDDCVIPEYFLEEVEKSMLDGEIMSYFVGNRPWMRDLYDQGYSYVSRPQYWGCCAFYPAWLTRGFTEWFQQYDKPTGHPFTYKVPMHGKMATTQHLADVVVASYVKSVKRKFMLTLPNLVNHGLLKSSVGNSCNGPKWSSSVFGKALLRPWDKSKIYLSKQ